MQAIKQYYVGILVFLSYLFYLAFLKSDTNLISASIGGMERLILAAYLCFLAIFIVKTFLHVRDFQEKANFEHGRWIVGALICVLAGYHFYTENSMYWAGTRVVENQIGDWLHHPRNMKIEGLQFRNDAVDASDDRGTWYTVTGTIMMSQTQTNPFTLVYVYDNGQWNYNRCLMDANVCPEELGKQLQSAPQPQKSDKTPGA